MEMAVKSFFLASNHEVIGPKQRLDGFVPILTCNRISLSPCRMGYGAKNFSVSKSSKYLPALNAVLSGEKDVGVSSSQSEDYSVSTTNVDEGGEIKISVEVSGAKTREIFNDVFDEMVAAAQPIPGFRRVKGGKTPNVPKNVLLEVLGSSRVYKKVIKKVINSVIAAYIEKEGYKVSKELRIEQSFEDLEDTFEPDEKFFFDAVIQVLENKQEQ